MKKAVMVAVFLAVAQVHVVRPQSRETSGREILIPAHAKQIQVDENCRIHEVAPHSNGLKQHVYTDRGVCDVGTYQISSREETDVDDAKRHHRTVTIREHTFTLHNPTPDPVTFVVEQGIPKGWAIDSDPLPNEVTSGTAVFLISAQAGETVALHVGERHPPIESHPPAPAKKY